MYILQLKVRRNMKRHFDIDKLQALIMKLNDTNYQALQ